MPEHPVDGVSQAADALRGLDALLILAETSQDGTPNPASIAAIITPIAALLEASVAQMERLSAPARSHLRPV